MWYTDILIIKINNINNMAFPSNKRRSVVLLVFILLIIAGIAVLLFLYNGNLRGIVPRQLTAITLTIGQQVKVLSGYATSVLLYPLAAGETQKDVSFCNLKPNGSPAYEPSAYKALMDKRGRCLSGYMEATKLREQSGIIQGNLGTVESLLAALSMTGKELASAADYGFSVVVIPSGTFLPKPIQYASGIQMKCVVNTSGGKSAEGIGTLQNFNASTFAISTPESVARFKALEKKIAALIKSAQDMMANGFDAGSMWTILTKAIGLKSEMLAANIPLTPAAVQKYYRSILASGPTGDISMGINRDENNMRTECAKSIPWVVDKVLGEDVYYRGSIGIASLAETVGFTDVCLPTEMMVKEIQASVTAHSQRFFKMRTSLDAQLRANTAALKKLEDNNYNCNSAGEAEK